MTSAVIEVILESPCKETLKSIDLSLYNADFSPELSDELEEEFTALKDSLMEGLPHLRMVKFNGGDLDWFFWPPCS